MITNLQKKENRTHLKEAFNTPHMESVFPHDAFVPESDKKAGYLSYKTLSAVIGGVIDARHIFEDPIFTGNRVLLNGKEMRNRKGETFLPVIVKPEGAAFLMNYTNETVYQSFGLYVWAVPYSGLNASTEIEI